MISEAVYMVVVVGEPMMLIAFVPLILFHLIWFWCVWHRIPMAEATLSIAIERLHKYWSVTWVSLGFSILKILWFVSLGLAFFGVLKCSGLIEEGRETQESDSGYYSLMGVCFVFVMFWGSLVMGYIVHAICAGVMGTWYFNTSRKRTVTDAFVRACTTSLGSLSFAAAIVAIIRALEQLARQNRRRAAEKGDMLACFIALCLRCILRLIGDIINYLNKLAIIRVAVYGEPFCVAAKRTMNMIKYRGMDQIINDDLSGMPV